MQLSLDSMRARSSDIGVAERIHFDEPASARSQDRCSFPLSNGEDNIANGEDEEIESEMDQGEGEDDSSDRDFMPDE